MNSEPVQEREICNVYKPPPSVDNSKHIFGTHLHLNNNVKFPIQKFTNIFNIISSQKLKHI